MTKNKNDNKIKLDVIKCEIGECTRCSLCKTPGKPVPGEGNIDTDIVFIGEGPGSTEAEQGRPFVGRAGKLLDNMILSIDFKREDVWIGNIVKHRPPNNRKPTPEEMKACMPFLIRQLEIIQPKVIIALGNTALGGLTGIDGGIVRRCGKWEDTHIINGRATKVLPVFHPSALLRRAEWKEPAWHALQKAKKFLDDS